MTHHTDAIPLIDLEAARLADHFYMAAPRIPTRPPPYMEEDVEEPPPTYREAVRRGMKAVQRYPATKVQSRRSRLFVFMGITICLLVIIVVPIAVGGSDGSTI